MEKEGAERREKAMGWRGKDATVVADCAVL